MQDFKKLKVWQDSIDFSTKVYSSTSKFPREEMYGLTNQIRRAANSISANLAEGCGRNTNKDFIRFLYMSIGSASEVESHLRLAKSLQYINQEEFMLLDNEVDKIRRKIINLIKKINV